MFKLLPKGNEDEVKQNPALIVFDTVSCLRSRRTYLFCVLLFFIMFLYASTVMNPIKTQLQISNSNYFKKPPGTEDLNCAWVLDGNHPEYIKMLAANRTVYNDPADESELPMDCESIYERHRFVTAPTSNEEEDFPIAISRLVYRDYFYHEMVLAALYQPQNHYCFSVDRKTTPLFRKRFESLAKCFPNVIISNNSRELYSSGYNLDWANIDCLAALKADNRRWKYVMVLQNHDFPSKTNREIVQIFKWLNGTTDISITHGFEHRVNWNLTWTVNSIGLFRNDSKFKRKYDEQDVKLVFAKGDNEMSASRGAIDYIFDEMNITEFVSRINREGVFGVDEIVFPTLMSMPELNVPGHYTQECTVYRKMNTYITRRSNFGNKSKCYSKNFRHGICIYGVEDLRDHVHNTPFININKLIPSFDFNAVVCELEALHNRTFLVPFEEGNLNKTYYDNLRQKLLVKSLSTQQYLTVNPLWKAMSKAKRDDLQVLRFVAISSVLLFHLWPQTFANGYLGVDMFFTLSGFLMFKILSSKELNASTIRTFYFRRLKRILPAHFIIVQLTLLAGYMCFTRTEYKGLLRQSTSAVTLTSNMFNLPEFGYSVQNDDYNLFLHTWSLSVEVQFYLICPMILACLSALKSKNEKAPVAFVLSGIVASFSYQCWNRNGNSLLQMGTIPVRRLEKRQSKSPVAEVFFRESVTQEERHLT
ncbi:unnamed protein product [Bursaphelenchus xylophilus]|uniref:(pine wood nematode) hypothetical protein n=1 Tax=Bursaphelenchus xylophilus TaxID=6326 RepID=A0A1I7RQB6_BURXY|nr:unnamed protein product [Bursaphelenchus xylophilus]CAG9104313.1 unnamed protein product [Bursaphelenchus xylophilus]